MTNLIHHKLYFKAAQRHAKDARRAEASVKDLENPRSEWTKQDLIDQFIIACIESGTASIIYSALTVEAYINFYGIVRIGKSEFNRDFSRKDVRRKWREVPKHVTGASIPEGCEAFVLLNKLIDARNKLVHYEFSEDSPVEFYPYVNALNQIPLHASFALSGEAASGLDAVRKILIELSKIDPNVSPADIEWAEDEQKPFHLMSSE
jgi:hypothetical protein